MKKDGTSLIKALVIDDNEVNQVIIANMLLLFNIPADQVFQGEEAVLMSKMKAYDIVFVDHLMPKMNGLLTVEGIRRESPYSPKTIIIALTSDLSDDIIDLYKAAGANEVYERPLELVQLAGILSRWYPTLQFTSPSPKLSSSYRNNTIIENIIAEISEIDFKAGTRFAAGDPLLFVNILEASLKDLQACIDIIAYSITNNSMTELQSGVHKLKSILSNLGALLLNEKASNIEKLILHGDWNGINYKNFLDELVGLKDKIQDSLKKYPMAEPLDIMNKMLMSDEEYEHCLLSTIYYIKRYEYDSIVKEIEHLISLGPLKLKDEFEEVLKDIKAYRYEKALDFITKLKKETGGLPIPE